MIPPDGIDGHGADDDPGDDDVIAGEFALGTLPFDERGRAAARIGSDPDFAARVRAWEERLVPMAEAVGPVAPPARLYAGIEGRLFPATDREARGLWGSLGFWRGFAIASLAAFVLAAGTLVFYQLRPQALVQPLVAALDAKGSDVKVVAFYEPEGQRLVVRPLAGSAAADRDFELWFIEPGKDPVPLGLMPKDGKAADMKIEPALAARFAGGATLAISVEPLGGSPSGKPTGPVVAAGELKAV